MKKIFYLFLAFVAVSCYDDQDTTYSTLDIQEKGAVVNVSNIVGGFYNLSDPQNTSVSFDLSGQGEDISSVDIFKSFNGGGQILHGTTTPGTVTISLVDALDGTGVSIDDLEVGDQFVYSFKPTTSSGVYNSGETLLVDLSCPSDLAGEYSASTSGTSTDPCCPGVVTATSDVTLTGENGSYVISDFSTGIYLAWYEVYGISAGMQTDGTLNGNLKDVCGMISGDAMEPFGTAVSIEGSLDASTGVITYTWVNGYDDSATVVLTPK